MSPKGDATAAIGPIETVDYHTGGEPFRIVTGGVPEIPGDTVLERRRYARDHLDAVRRLLIDEPRGHADMYGAHVVPPNDAGADLGVVFFHNEGYSTACGHGTIALITWAIEAGRIEAREPVTEVGLDVPSGRLACRAQVANGKVESVEFTNVPSYVEATDLEVHTSRGPVHLDVAFGGAFYGSLEARRVGLDVSPVSLPSLIALQRELRRELDERLDPTHPDEPELRGTYGIIYWQTETPEDGVELVQRNVDCDKLDDFPFKPLLYGEDPSRASSQSESTQAAYLVLSDSWYPGWVAAVDGAEVPIERANLLFRAVRLPPGEHVVEFRYEPRSVRLGALVSAGSIVASIVLLVGLGVWQRRRRRGAWA